MCELPYHDSLRYVEFPENSVYVWVTLPGDNAGHALTEEQAKQLLRELEEVV